jgi:hypothetical protein
MLKRSRAALCFTLGTNILLTVGMLGCLCVDLPASVVYLYGVGPILILRLLLWTLLIRYVRDKERFYMDKNRYWPYDHSKGDCRVCDVKESESIVINT